MGNPSKATFRDSSFVVAFLDRVVVAITEGDATLEAVDAWHKNIELLSRAYPDGIGIFFVIGGTAIVPTGPVRARAQQLFKSLQSNNVRAMATVIEGDGFGSAAKRAAFTMISSASIGSVRAKVHPDIRVAAQWFATESASQKLRVAPVSDLMAFVAGLERPR